MCVVSMVYDHYRPIIPWIAPEQPWQPSPKEQRDLGKLLDDFQKARDAAKEVDKRTGQKDCADPEKAKLEARVTELERRLASLEKARKRRTPRRKHP